ncbi:MAG: transferrin-binding protein-like solute binding protein [Immundisolibacterales bacterium]|nr:transferrin-binding protein-like solute binding protein [Immundisolibacterales bacterium]
MQTNVLRGLYLAATFTGAFALEGCGGGGGGMSGAIPPVERPTEPDPATLTIPTGMHASTAPGVTARGAGDSIASLLPQPGRRFAPVSARSRTDEFHVTAISSDGNNGFRVTYVVGGRARTVHFEAGDYEAGGFSGDYYKETQDGGRFWLDSAFGAFSESERNRGSGRFEYVEMMSAGVSGYRTPNRQHLAFGARTDAEALPTATASYSGQVFAENHPIEYDNLETRGRMWGNWRLTADFSQSTLRGDIRFVAMRAAGESAYRSLPHTTYFSIENGEIVDGRFTASVSGADSNRSAPASRTLAGFEGDMLGEFYGPGAEEAGGVLRATRASDSRVLVGAFGGKRSPELDPTLPEGELTLNSVGVDRDYVATSVQLTDVARVTGIESDGATGFHVIYRVDGNDHRVHLGEQIYFNRYDEFGLFNHQAAGLFALTDQTGSFLGTPEFSHFDVHGWAIGRYADDGALQSTLRGFVVSGVSTEATDLPTGTATYEGRAHFLTWPSDTPRQAAGSRGDGRLTLSTDFGASTVEGTIDQIGDVLGAVSELGIENGAIEEGTLTADLRGAQGGAAFDGDMTGRFFGPGAAEVGGVLEGSLTGQEVVTVVQGWIGGKMQ